MLLTKNLWLLPSLCLCLSVTNAQAESILPARLAPQATPSNIAQTDAAQNNAAQNDIDTRAAQVVQLLAAQQYERVRSSLHPDLRETISTEQIQEQWQRLLTERGAFIRVVSTRSATTFDGAFVLVTVAFQQATDDLMVIFNDQQQIVGFDILERNDNIQAIAEAFVDALAVGDYVRARSYFHPSLKMKVLPADLEQAWQATQAENGQFRRRLTSQVSPGIDADVVQVNVEFGNATKDILLVFKRGRIAGFDFP